MSVFWTCSHLSPLVSVHLSPPVLFTMAAHQSSSSPALPPLTTSQARRATCASIMSSPTPESATNVKKKVYQPWLP